jgi:hypothetical protein
VRAPFLAADLTGHRCALASMQDPAARRALV